MTTVADFFADKPYTAALIGSVAILAIGGASLFAYKLGLFKRLIVKENVLLGPYLVLYREVKVCHAWPGHAPHCTRCTSQKRV